MIAWDRFTAASLMVFGSLLSVLVSNGQTYGASVYTAGHADIGVNYVTAGGPRFTFRTRFDGDSLSENPANPHDIRNQIFSAEAVAIRVRDDDPPRLRERKVDEETMEVLYDLTGPEWDFLGVAQGEPVWTLPQTSEIGKPFFGFATDNLSPPSAWNGPISFALEEIVSGPAGGEVSMWQNDFFGNPTVMFASSNGILIELGGVDDGEDDDFPQNIGGGTYTDLAPITPPGGYQSVLVQSISDNGMTLGTYRDSSNVSRAFVRLADGTWTYPDLLGSPRAINNAGQIAGSFLDPANGNTRTAYVASVPEPSGFVLAFSLVGAAIVRWRRRLPAISRPVALASSPMKRGGIIGAVACSVGLILTATAQAQHAGDILVGKTAASQLTAVNLPTGTKQLPAVNSGSLFGWASNSMGVDNFFGADPTRDISQLASGGYVSLEVISIDPGLSFRSFSAFTTVFADEAGETLPIGPSNSLHNHPIVFIDGAVVGPDFRSPLTAQIRFIDTGATALAASPAYTMTFAPAVPEPASLSLLGASAVFLLHRRRATQGTRSLP